jgi:hypothetical protein
MQFQTFCVRDCSKMHNAPVEILMECCALKVVKSPVKYGAKRAIPLLVTTNTVLPS